MTDAIPRPNYAWVLNLDAEIELAQASYTPSAQVARQQAVFGSAAERMLGPNDVLLANLGFGEPRQHMGRAWCPTPRALSIMRAAGVPPEPHPPVSTIRIVNHRSFAHTLKLGLPEQHLLRDEASLYALLANTQHPWLLKRPLAFAGRGQRRIVGPIDGATAAWITASLRSDSLIAEPLVLLRAEFSLHGFLWRDGRFQLGHPCVQTVTDRGVFRDVRRALSDDLASHERAALFGAAETTAYALNKAGYFGPFGIDAYRYRMHEGATRESFCALSEINARYTMSFVTGFPTPPWQLHL